MCTGVEKVILLPLTATISLISLSGRPGRLNHESDAGKRIVD